jgi:thymidylate synthase (FAD)
MKLIKPSYEIVKCPKDALQDIERAARICYKSENKIDGVSSASRLVTSLLSKKHYAMLEFGGDIWVKFISDRGFTHELVRHRLASYAQVSTRYCNYSKDKFGNELAFIDPSTLVECSDRYQSMYIDGCKNLYTLSEYWYMEMVKNGCIPELARQVLPIGIMTEINIKANIVEWRHIFGQRCSKKAHPRMRELMVPLIKELSKRIPLVFDDLLFD